MPEQIYQLLLDSILLAAVLYIICGFCWRICAKYLYFLPSPRFMPLSTPRNRAYYAYPVIRSLPLKTHCALRPLSRRGMCPEGMAFFRNRRCQTLAFRV
ncbi:MAG: hypothetical protein N2491_06340 [Negativicutes bacterium]|nr:hypothetical protein [Negativicutes bacterium]